jgi:hypothetical protein
VAPKFGKWTLALDGKPWSVTFEDLVTDAVFSPDGRRLAALGKNGNNWWIVVDGKVWKDAHGMAWKPVFSRDGGHVAVRVEKDGAYSLVVDGRLWNRKCDWIWDPQFGPDSDRLLVRTIEGGKYFRHVFPLTELTG